VAGKKSGCDGERQEYRMDYGQRVAFFRLVVDAIKKTNLVTKRYSRTNAAVKRMDALLKGCFSDQEWDKGLVEEGIMTFYNDFLRPMFLPPPDLSRGYEFFLSVVMDRWTEDLELRLRA